MNDIVICVCITDYVRKKSKMRVDLTMLQESDVSKRGVIFEECEAM